MNMLLKMEGIPSNYVAFVLVILATFTESKITTVRVVEGDVAFLNFSYSYNITKFTLQEGSGAHIYNSKSPAPLSSSNLKLRNETDGTTCFLYLTIDPVTRDDRGGYILFAYKDDPTKYEDDRIQLWVEYPPGKPSCSLSEEHIDQDWVRLHCTAPIGSISGFIICYQSGMKIPPLTSPQEDDEILSQTLLAKVGDLVYCCSGALDQTKDRCECKDSVWDPIQNKQVINVTDPCPPTVPVQYSTFSRQPTENAEFELTSQSTPQQMNYGKAHVGFIVATCVIGLVIVIIAILMLVRHYLMFKRHPVKCPNLKTEESFICDVKLEKF